MNTQDQIPAMEEKLKTLDVQIGEHIAAKGRLLEDMHRLCAQMDYRDRCIRELGAERSRVANFSLGLD